MEIIQKYVIILMTVLSTHSIYDSLIKHYVTIPIHSFLFCICLHSDKILNIEIEYIKYRKETL